MENTKENILLVALHLFARDGYEAVSVSQIAGVLGITKGALYRHYTSKRDIFDHILQRMEQGDSEQAAQHDMPEESVESVPEQYQAISMKNLLEFSISMFEYWTEDDFSASFRKMLTLEQFRSEEMQSLYQQYLVSGPVGYVRDLFEGMGITEAERKAAQFYAIMYLFYSIYDGAEQKDGIKQQLVTALSGMIQEMQNE